jgi:hypothetical protein
MCPPAFSRSMTSDWSAAKAAAVGIADINVSERMTDVHAFIII